MIEKARAMELLAKLRKVRKRGGSLLSSVIHGTVSGEGGSERIY